VREMNRLGMLVDVSHLVEASFWDVLEVSTQPVVATHSNARALVDCLRNLTDEQIVAVAETGGVVCATAMRLCPDENSNVETFLDQVDHMVKLVGPEHVGHGTDFCREGYVPPDLQDISQVGNLVKGLLTRGYNAQAIRGIMGENLLRVLKAVL
jgi:membrane dipeptidase